MSSVSADAETPVLLVYCECRLVEGDQRYLIEGLRCGDIDVGLIYDWNLGPDIVLERMVAQRPYVLLAAGERWHVSLRSRSTSSLVIR